MPPKKPNKNTTYQTKYKERSKKIDSTFNWVHTEDRKGRQRGGRVVHTMQPPQQRHFVHGYMQRKSRQVIDYEINAVSYTHLTLPTSDLV